MSDEVANTVENPHAGKGSSVLLDIGGEVGALVIDMPAELEGVEIELRPAGRTIFSSSGQDGAPPADEHGHEPGHGHGHDHGQDHGHEHEHGHGHGHGHEHGLPHVAVVPRPSPEGDTIYSAVFFEVPQGSYELYVRPDGPVQLTVEVSGGHVTHADWPQ